MKNRKSLSGALKRASDSIVRFFRKFISKRRSEKDIFLSEWIGILKTDAALYNGLFANLERVSLKAAKKPEKVLKEWHSRTVHKRENSISKLCCKTLVPIMEGGDVKACAKCARLLLKAARKAGIEKESAKKLVLNQTTVRAYIEWDDKALYIGDRVKVLNPAWYQSGRIIEQGHCLRCKSLYNSENCGVKK